MPFELKKKRPRFSGLINDDPIEFQTTDEMKKYPYKETDKVILHGPKDTFIFSPEQAKGFVQEKKDKYLYSMNKKDKGTGFHYKSERHLEQVKKNKEYEEKE